MVQQCRACLTTNTEAFFDMNATTTNGRYTYIECFQQCTQLSTDDDLQLRLPTTICAECAHDLQVAYGFLVVARQADVDLRSSLGAKVLEVEEEEPEMERLEMLEESEAEEAEEECLLEELVGPSDGADDKVEYMEDETMEEEHIIEDCVEEETLSMFDDIIQKQKVAHLTVTLNVSLANDGSNGLTMKEEQLSNGAVERTAIASFDVPVEDYDGDENDDEYLGEYIEVPGVPIPRDARWKCPICKLVMRGDVNLEGHFNVHKNVWPHKCSSCPAAFRSHEAWLRHMKRCHNYVLPLNRLQLAMRKQQEQQQQQQQQQHVDQSDRCNNETERESDMEKEKEVKETDTALWSCDLCKLQLHSEAALREHQKSHLNERTHECGICAKRFANAYTLRTHMRNLHSPAAAENTEKETDAAAGVDATGNSDTIVQCQLCKKQLLRQNFAKHTAMHERKQQQQQQPKAAAKDETEQIKFLCAHCPRECKNRKLLYQHEKMHEGETPGIVYVCADCERQYATQHLLEQHRKQAHKERDNICPICGNAFKLKNQLVNHMKLHLEKNIQCPQCEKRYARQFDLNVHLRTHTGELPFACHLCEKRFAIKVRLTYHLQKHLGVKHCCKECGAEFNSKQKLKAHSFKHSGMPYRCEMCNDHGFANRDVFKRHLMRVHHASMSDEALVEMFQRNTGKTTRIRHIDEMKHEVVLPTYKISADAPPTEGEEEEEEERLINDEDIAMESEVVHT